LLCVEEQDLYISASLYLKIRRIISSVDVRIEDIEFRELFRVIDYVHICCRVC
jgi:hypothetical protein